MEFVLPKDTPDYIKLSYDESVRIMGEVLIEAQTASKNYDKETNIRKYLAYALKFISLIGAVLITAGIFPHQLAICIVIIYGIDSALSNSKRLIAAKQAAIAYTTIEKKLVRTHQTKQTALFSEPDKIKRVKKITSLNNDLIAEAHKQFETVEEAIKVSDIQTLQALSLDEDKLHLATQHLKKP